MRRHCPSLQKKRERRDKRSLSRFARDLRAPTRKKGAIITRQLVAQSHRHDEERTNEDEATARERSAVPLEMTNSEDTPNSFPPRVRDAATVTHSFSIETAKGSRKARGCVWRGEWQHRASNCDLLLSPVAANNALHQVASTDHNG
jgi:hypothetical protein